MVIRRCGAILLAVLLAAVLCGSLIDVLQAQTLGLYWDVPINLSGGTLAQRSQNSLICNVGTNSVFCSGTHMGSYANPPYGRLEYISMTAPAVPITAVIGVWFDFVFTHTQTVETYLSAFKTSQYIRNDAAGTISGRACTPFITSGDPRFATLWQDVGCTHIRTTGFSLGVYDMVWGSAGNSGTQNWTWSAAGSNFHWRVSVEPPPDEPPPGTHPGGGGGSCVFTTTMSLTDTQSLTDTIGITATQGISVTPDPGGISATVTYTRSANLAENYSFESAADGGPASWDQVMDGAFIHQSWVPWWNSGGDYANTGSRSINTGAPFDLFQDVSLHGPDSDYVVGIHGRCLAAGCSSSVAVYWSPLFFGSIGGLTGSPKAGGSISGEEYVFISGTHSAGGGVASIYIRGLGSGAVIDDFYIYPTDEAGNVRCDDSELYPPLVPGDGSGGGGGGGGSDGGLPGSGATPIGGIPAPIGGAGSACYNCFTPRDVSASAVSYWIAWLGCVIRNMFSCSLRVWLLVIGNWINGQIQIGLAFMIWIPATTQGFVNWIAAQVVPGVRSSVNIVMEPATNFWDVMVAWIGLIQAIVSGILALMSQGLSLFGDLVGWLADMFLQLINLLISLITAIRLSFSVEPIVFDLNGVTAPGTGGTGPNEGKMLWLFLSFLGLVDQLVVGGFAALFTLAALALAIGVILWTLSWWRDLISF